MPFDQHSAAKSKIENRVIFCKHRSILRSTKGTRRDLEEIMQLVFTGKFKPALDRQFRLEKGAAAPDRPAAGEQMGKIILVI